jgi:hypothetical protein
VISIHRSHCHPFTVSSCHELREIACSVPNAATK